MEKFFTFLFALVLSTGLLAQNIGKMPPDFTLKDLSGMDYVLSENKGKVILVFLVGYNCTLCIASSQDVKPKLVDAFKSNDKFQVVVIDVWDGSKAGVLGFKNTTGLEGTFLQKGSSVASTWSTTYDRLFVIDKKGNLAFKGTKSAKNEISETKSAIQTALNEVVTSVAFAGDQLEFELTQNYPNPFENKTKIAFRIAEASDVRLSVFDITGKLVDNPVDRFYDRGEHEIELSRNRYQNGIYFYRVDAGEYTATRRMVVK